jgi:hypothetical protein
MVDVCEARANVADSRDALGRPRESLNRGARSGSGVGGARRAVSRGWLGAVFAALACQGPADPATAPEDPTPASTDTTDVEAPEDTGTERPNLTARLVDPDGAPLGAIPATACSDVLCYVGRTSGSGRLEFSVLRTGRYVLHNLAWPGAGGAGDALGWSSFFDFVDVTEGEPVDLFREPFVVPRVTERLSPPSATGDLSFGDGALTLRLDGSRLTPPDGVDAAAAWTIGAVDVPDYAWPRGGLDGATVVRAWAFAPFELSTDDPAGIQVRVQVPTEAGELELRVASYLDGAATGRFTAVPTTRVGDVLEGTTHELTWLLVVAP